MGINTKSFLHFWFQVNEFIIQWATLALIFVLMFWAVTSYLRNNKSQAPNMKKALKKVTKETQFPLNQSVAPVLGISASAKLRELKKELRLKDTQIEALKKKLEARSKTFDKTAELDKIKSLEKKLAEYEIVEGDIADLSRYKEENQKLRANLINKK